MAERTRIFFTFKRCNIKPYLYCIHLAEVAIIALLTDSEDDLISLHHLDP